MDAQGDNLLQRLVEQEQTLAGKVEAAQKQASDIIAEARQKAEAKLDEARARAEAVAERHRDIGNEEAERERADVLSRAESDANRIREAAVNQRTAATRLVMDRVLP